MKSKILAVLSLTIAALAGPGATATAAAPVQCGDTISGSVTLAGDLHCMTFVGLALAPGASLDLGGHTVFGENPFEDGIGVQLPDAGTVSITNGTLRGWGSGVANTDDGTPTQGPSRISHVLALDNTFGVAVTDFNGTSQFAVAVEVTDSTFVYNDYGVYGTKGSLVVRHSYFKGTSKTRSDPSGSSGVNSGGARLAVTNSTFQTMSTAIACFSGQPCSITGSVMRDGRIGVAVYQYKPQRVPVTITGNRFTRLGTGVLTSSSGGVVTIKGNRFSQSGVAVDATDSFVQLSANDVRDGTTGFTYHLTGERSDTTASVATNTFSGNHDGVYVDLPASQAPRVQLRANAANDNVDYGIYAPGATDRGGNTAAGNGHDPQCVGVVCA